MLTEYTCPRCTAKGFPGFTLGAKSRMVVECPSCQYEDPALGPSDFTQGIAAMPADGNAGPGWAGRTAHAVDLAPGAPQRQPWLATSTAPQSTYVPLPPQTPSPMTPADVIGLMEARSAWLVSEEARLEGEIAEGRARLAGVRAEQRRLAKMLHAGQPRERRLAARPLRAVNQ